MHNFKIFIYICLQKLLTSPIMKTNVHLISEQMTYFKAIAKRSLPSRYQHLAEDLAQDAILKAIEKVDYYDPSKGNFKSWLYRLTQNLCFDAIRKLDKMNIVPIHPNIVNNEKEDKKIERTEIKKIRNAMQFLSKRDRMLITYKFMFNLSGREMAQLLNIPEAQINVYFKRAKERLIDICKQAA